MKILAIGIATALAGLTLAGCVETTPPVVVAQPAPAKPVTVLTPSGTLIAPAPAPVAAGGAPAPKATVITPSGTVAPAINPDLYGSGK